MVDATRPSVESQATCSTWGNPRPYPAGSALAVRVTLLTSRFAALTAVPLLGETPRPDCRRSMTRYRFANTAKTASASPQWLRRETLPQCWTHRTASLLILD
ncbi:hypothetical protein [Dendronalium sp. ChiSLP03b]|uniref:hypothetical protein n=1 Tax=Dendronalium sp. ChiSLP03b TaxID=3075381 RepID=UPI002AD5775C|nr:hypothetical protein [Dendronalium sp. ChiSLP03b]MDZ8207064.1 hypothetical protein [Dendronalium sp. ChiSLP03b]